jgi:hypothetical protein
VYTAALTFASESYCCIVLNSLHGNEHLLRTKQCTGWLELLDGSNCAALLLMLQAHHAYMHDNSMHSCTASAGFRLLTALRDDKYQPGGARN